MIPIYPDSGKIPGFLPDDYDIFPSLLDDDRKLDDADLRLLKLIQSENEDSDKLEDYMSAQYDSYLVLGYNPETKDDNDKPVSEYCAGACSINIKDLDLVHEMGNLLGYFIFKHPKLERVIKHALKVANDFRKEDENPEPPMHMELGVEHRFHLNRYERINREEYFKVEDEFMAACGNPKKRHDMAMRRMLTAVADQISDNEDVAIDFFCNFDYGVESDGDNVSTIKVNLLREPCTWDKAEAKRDRFEELCKEYNVPCRITWLEI